MNNAPKCDKGKIILFVSIAINIFLVAFLLGRMSLFGGMPPHDFMRGDHHGMPPMMRGGIPERGAGMMPPPPPFFGPGDLFSHKEMEEGFTEMKKNFEQIQALREEFAARLKKQPVTKEEVLKHFSDVDQLMSNGRNQMQDKAAAKISTMTQEERQKFADRLLGKE